MQKKINICNMPEDILNKMHDTYRRAKVLLEEKYPLIFACVTVDETKNSKLYWSHLEGVKKRSINYSDDNTVIRSIHSTKLETRIEVFEHIPELLNAVIEEDKRLRDKFTSSTLRVEDLISDRLKSDINGNI